jgi:S-adenosylmethionine hydrolase
MVPGMTHSMRPMMKWMMGALAGLILTGRLWGAALVFQTDFGLKDGAVSAMKGVAFGVDPNLHQFDLTHEIPAFNVWEAAFRLKQTVQYWPAGTVFVNVVDPGVGTERRAIVAKTRGGHYIVTPDNGTLTFLAETPGLEEVRVIDIARQRLKGSEESYTFHGRDLFAYVGARIAAGKLEFRDCGVRMTNDVVRLPYEHARRDGKRIIGTIPVLDVQYGNVWSNLPKRLFQELNPKVGESFVVRIGRGGRVVWEGRVPYGETFGAVPPGKPVLFLNSLLEVAVALNQDSFAAVNHVASGADWTFEVSRL